MRKYVILLCLTLFLLIPVLSIEANEESSNTEVELDLTQFAGEVAGPPQVIVNDTKMRYSWDVLIYSGDVNVNTWAVPAGVDDESIDVDFFAPDTTLRAVVACPDSTLRILRSDDRGVNWSQVGQITFGAGGAAEPHIVHGPDSTYHVFCLYVQDEADIYTLARRTANDATISGSNYFLAGSDSVQNYSVCTDRIQNHDYSVYIAYQDNALGSSSRNMLMLTTDQGQNWTAPGLISQGYVGFPNIAYGRGNILYLSYIYDWDPNIIQRVRRSLNSGSTWDSPVTLESDTFPKMSVQLAAACDNSGDVWAIWSKWDALGSAPEDWGLRWSWSQDSGVSWSAANWTNSRGDSNEYLPSIAVNDYYGSTDNDPFVCYLRASTDHNDPYVRTFNWSSGAWTTSSREGEYNASLTRPIVAFNFPLEPAPAFAYVGEGEQDVYFDTWENAGVEEKDVVEDERITCSLDCSLIVGTGTLKYNVPNAGHVKVSMFNALGQEVATLYEGIQESGENTLTVSSDNLPHGIYYILVNTPAGTGTAKLTVVK
jgi:hypothetical protein